MCTSGGVLTGTKHPGKICCGTLVGCLYVCSVCISAGSAETVLN